MTDEKKALNDLDRIATGLERIATALESLDGRFDKDESLLGALEGVSDVCAGLLPLAIELGEESERRQK